MYFIEQSEESSTYPFESKDSSPPKELPNEDKIRALPLQRNRKFFGGKSGTGNPFYKVDPDLSPKIQISDTNNRTNMNSCSNLAQIDPSLNNSLVHDPNSPSRRREDKVKTTINFFQAGRARNGFTKCLLKKNAPVNADSSVVLEITDEIRTLTDQDECFLESFTMQLNESRDSSMSRAANGKVGVKRIKTLKSSVRFTLGSHNSNPEENYTMNSKSSKIFQEDDGRVGIDTVVDHDQILKEDIGFQAYVQSRIQSNGANKQQTKLSINLRGKKPNFRIGK